jgi:hypothetical protein
VASQPKSLANPPFNNTFENNPLFDKNADAQSLNRSGTKTIKEEEEKEEKMYYYDKYGYL